MLRIILFNISKGSVNYNISYFCPIGPMRGGFSRYISPESKEGACESLKGSIALAIDVLF
jgi:hypothetical protein